MNARWTLRCALASAVLGGCRAVLGLHPPLDETDGGVGLQDSDSDELDNETSGGDASRFEPSGDQASSDEASIDDAADRGDTSIDDHGEPAQTDVATDAADGGAPIVWRGTTTAIFPGGSDAGSAIFRLSDPGAQPDDILVAGLAFGSVTATAPATITAPAGWTLIARKDHLGYSTLALYWARGSAVDAGPFDWSVPGVAGVGWLSAYGGVRSVQPISATAGADLADGGTIVTAPALSAVPVGSVVIASFGGYTTNNVGITWSDPAVVPGEGGPGTPMTVRASLYNNGRRSAITADALQGMSGSAGPFESITSTPLAEALGMATSLAP
jgi:hypothetical protein